MTNFTIPLIRMRIDRDRLTFSLRFGLGIFAGPWECERAELRRVRITDRRLRPAGGVELWFDRFRMWSFWSTSPEQVLDHLTRLGYPTEPA